MKMEMILTVLISYIVLLLHLCHGQNATRDVNICQDQSETRARIAQIKSPNFPAPVKAPWICQCTVTGSDKMDIFVKFLLSKQNTDNSTIGVNYTYKANNTASFWDPGNYGNLKVSQDNKVFIATGVSSVKMMFKASGREDSVTIFEIAIKAVSQGVLSVDCTGTALSNKTDSQTDGDEGGILPALDKFCSAQLVLILGSLCTALLLILLVVSIVLCCVMPPKKKKRFMDVIRRSRVINEDKNKTKKDSFIYDEVARKSRASFGEPPTLYSDSTLQARPVSGVHYMNSNVVHSTF